MRFTFTRGALAATLLIAPLSIGCTDTTPYQTDKPIVIDPENDVEENSDEWGNDMEHGIDNAADTVTPDDSAVDVNTPLGDVEITKDPATGDTDVDVDLDDDENQ